MKLLELCCGTKSIGRVFAAHGWDVTTLDNEPRWQPDVLADVRDYHPEHYDVVWASPPCTYFSRYDQRSLYPDEPIPSTELVEACWRVIGEAAPRVWWVENVRGARSWFAPLLGTPVCHRGAWWLWSNALWLPPCGHYYKGKGHRGYNAPRAQRLPLPPPLCEAIYAATVASL